MAVLLPWPLRHERTAAVAAARQQKETSQAGAAHAAVIERDIVRMQEENNFAGAFARALRGEGD